MDHFQSSHNIFINWSQVPEALPEHLHQLYLESNSIDALPESFLGGFTQLQYVRIAHNQLTDKGIPANTFNVTGLVELDLSFNKLERIPPVSTTLQHLYLQANQIKGKCVLIVTLFTWLCMCSPLWFVVEGLSWKKSWFCRLLCTAQDLTTSESKPVSCGGVCDVSRPISAKPDQ